MSDGGLERLARRLEAAGKADLRELHDEVGEGIVAAVDKGFATSTDPYGRAWLPTKAGNKPLHGRTLDLSTSARFVPLSNGVEIQVTDPKSVFHQGGTRRRISGGTRSHIPARPMLPVGGRMPDSWRDAIRVAVKRFFARLFSSGGS